MTEKRMALIAGPEMIRHTMSDFIREYFDIAAVEDCAGAGIMDREYLQQFSILFVGVSDPEDERKEFIKYLADSGIAQCKPVIVVSTIHDHELKRFAYMMGAAEYFRVPFDSEIMTIKLRNTLKLFHYKDELEENSARMLRAERENHQRTIDFLANIIEARNMENSEHVIRVKGFTRILAQQVMEDWPEFGLDDEKVKLISSASSLHDLGKIMIRDDVLMKPDRLTPDEAEYMKAHTIIGCMLLNKMENMLMLDFYRTCYDICRYHHERADGSGYPDGLFGDDIPLSARIVSVADCYDALTAERSYKGALPPDTAFDMILSGECGAFDEKILYSFKKCRIRLKTVAHMASE